MKQKAKPMRVQFKRDAGFKLPENAVLVNRGTKWNTPFVILTDGDGSRVIDDKGVVYSGYVSKEEARVLAVQEYEKWKFLSVLDYGASRTDLSELKGKVLACTCPLDIPCHADVLLRYANDPPEYVEDLNGVVYKSYHGAYKSRIGRVLHYDYQGGVMVETTLFEQRNTSLTPSNTEAWET